VFNARQISSIGIFSMFIYGTLLFGEFRLAFAFGGIAMLMVGNLLSVERFTQAANLDVLIFLIGTFLVIGYLEENQFFEHVVSSIVALVGPRPQLLLMVMMVMASLFSALVGEVTAILFMAGAMLHLCSRYRLQPIPFVIMLVFACNNGSAMSSVGNPIGVLIALKTGLNFLDFLKWAAPVALVVDVVTFAICRYRRSLPSGSRPLGCWPPLARAAVGRKVALTTNPIPIRYRRIRFRRPIIAPRAFLRPSIWRRARPTASAGQFWGD
jgi:Na+/H+ antiporter NhaD/arsenite permease-like protein